MAQAALRFTLDHLGVTCVIAGAKNPSPGGRECGRIGTSTVVYGRVRACATCCGYDTNAGVELKLFISFCRV